MKNENIKHPSHSTVLAHFLSQCGLGSRRSCEKIIHQGHILVNNLQEKRLTRRIVPTDIVHYKDKVLTVEKKCYLLLHKPKGYICSNKDDHAKQIIFDLIKENQRLFTIGRLDKDSEGLLLLTNDGELANKLAHPRYGVKKTYLVDVQGNVIDTHLPKLTRGISIEGEFLRASSISIIKRSQHQTTLKIVMNEGKKREIRRLLAYRNYRVKRLLRIAVGPIHLGKFLPGFYRHLTKNEVNKLQELDDNQSSQPHSTNKQ